MAHGSQTNKSIIAAAIIVLWCVAAIFAGMAGLVAKLRPPLPQVVLFGFVALQLAAFRLSPAFREWLCSIPVSWLISVHLSRFVGFYFLWLFEHGRLPRAFAAPAGWGDIITAALACVLLIFHRVPAMPAPRVVLAWNIFGTVDILFVVINAARLALSSPASMAELLQFPLSLLPTFIVPLILFTHLVIFVRLKRQSQTASCLA